MVRIITISGISAIVGVKMIVRYSYRIPFTHTAGKEYRVGLVIATIPYHLPS